MKVIAVLPEGFEHIGAEELLELGAVSVKPQRRSVYFEADLRCLFRIYLLARLPFRLLREVASFPCDGPKSLYEGVRESIDWSKWLNPSMSFRVDVTGFTSGLSHSHFTALQVKNAVIDSQRDIWGKRSSINLSNPNLQIHLHLNRNSATLSFDGSLGSMHKRGYRPAMGIAPLKENLASGLIRLTGWDGSIPLVDPLCGSGSLLLEAANLSLGVPPGINRSFVFQYWKDFDERIWIEEKNFANAKQQRKQTSPELIGCEIDKDTFEDAKLNICSAKLQNSIEIYNKHFRELKLPNKKGIIICNPPYGKRVGFQSDLEELYREIGSFCKSHASGWDLWVLSGNPQLTKYLKLKANKKIPLSNGGIDCRWINYIIN